METTNGIRFSLQGKLLFPVVIALTLFMGSSALYLAHVLTERTEERFVTMLSAGNEILVKNIRNATESYKSVMRTISIIPQLKLLADVASGRGGRSPFEPIPDQYRDGVWGKAEELLLTLSDNFPDVVQFNFALRDGNVIASSRKATIGKVNVSDRKWFARVLDDEVVISAPLMSKSTGDKSVVVAAPVHGDAGGEGVIYAIVPCLRVVSDTIRNVKMSGAGYAYIVDGDSGLMVAHNTWSVIQSVNMFEYQPWMKALAPGDCGVKKDYVDSAGRRRLAVYRKEPLSGWIAVSCIPMEEMDEEKAFVRNRIFILTICGAFLAGLIISFVIRSATKDISRIGNFARRVTHGNFNGKLLVRRNDELGDLGDDIAAMVRSLKEHVEREIRSTEERRKEFAALRDALML
ncbi:MAG: hypothetical protein J5838_03395, partial [Desulfovibrio sp.]|nr:hypothetical protein [Desulfovibrio sp.]